MASEEQRPKRGRRPSGFSPRCTVCASENRAAIDFALGRGATLKTVAELYDVSLDAAHRHWHRHVSDQQKAALRAYYLKPGATVEALLAEEQPGLLGRLGAYRASLWHLFQMATDAGDGNAAARLGRELLKAEEMLAAQTGELKARAQAPIQHLHLTPDFLRLRHAISVALRPYPEALGAVTAALRDLDSTITTPVPAAPLIEARSLVEANR